MTGITYTEVYHDYNLNQGRPVRYVRRLTEAPRDERLPKRLEEARNLLGTQLPQRLSYAIVPDLALLDCTTAR